MIALLAAAGLAWGLATAWLFVASVARSARGARAGAGAGLVRAVRPAAVAGMLVVPALAGGAAVAAALAGFLVGRSALVLREVTRRAD